MKGNLFAFNNREGNKVKASLFHSALPASEWQGTCGDYNYR